MKAKGFPMNKKGFGKALWNKKKGFDNMIKIPYKRGYNPESEFLGVT